MQRLSLNKMAINKAVLYCKLIKDTLESIYVGVLTDLGGAYYVAANWNSLVDSVGKCIAVFLEFLKGFDTVSRLHSAG